MELKKIIITTPVVVGMITIILIGIALAIVPAIEVVVAEEVVLGAIVVRILCLQKTIQRIH